MGWPTFRSDNGVIDIRITEEDLKKTTFYAVVFITMGASANTYIDIPNYELLMQEFRVSTLFLGLMTGVFLIAYGISSLFWAYLNEKLSKRRGLLTITTSIASVLTFLMLFSRNFLELFIFRVSSGIFIGAISPIVYSILIDLYKSKERVRALYRWAFLSSVGSGIGFSLSSVFGGMYGWRGAFAIGFVMVFLGTIISFKVIEPPRGMSDEEIAEVIKKGKTYPYRISLEDLRKLPRDEILKMFLQHALFASIMWGAFGTWVIHMLAWECNLSSSQALVILSIISGGAILSLPFSRVLDLIRIRKPRQLPLVVGFLIFMEFIFYMLFIILFPRYPLDTKNIEGLIQWVLQYSDIQLVLLFGFLAMALGNIKGPILQATVADLYLPEYRATVMAVVNIASLVGRSIGIILAGALAEFISLRFSIVAINIFLFLVSLTWFSLSKFYYNRYIEIREILDKRARMLL